MPSHFVDIAQGNVLGATTPQARRTTCLLETHVVGGSRSTHVCKAAKAGGLLYHHVSIPTKKIADGQEFLTKIEMSTLDRGRGFTRIPVFIALSSAPRLLLQHYLLFFTRVPRVATWLLSPLWPSLGIIENPIAYIDYLARPEAVIHPTILHTAVGLRRTSMVEIAMHLSGSSLYSHCYESCISSLLGLYPVDPSPNLTEACSDRQRSFTRRAFHSGEKPAGVITGRVLPEQSSKTGGCHHKYSVLGYP